MFTTLLLNNKDRVSSAAEAIFTYDFAAYQIWARLSVKDQGRLGQATTLFQPSLLNASMHNIAKKLLCSVINHDVYQIKKILDVYPNILNMKVAKVMSGTRQSMEDVTAFEAALRMKSLPMLQLIAPYFDKLPNGQREKLGQLSEELSAGDASSFDFTEIHDAFDDVTFNKKDEHLLTLALEKFHHDFSSYIKQNKHFNMRDLITVFDLYNYRYYAWSDNHKALFWKEVINYVHSFMPLCYAEAFCKYFWNTTHNEPLSEETLKFKFGNEVTLPFVKSDTPLLDGYDHGQDNSYWGFVVGYKAWGAYSDFVNEQEQALAEFIQQNLQQLNVQVTPIRK
jgi:hypothetical protein